ncbi:MAG TPA: nuclear transport factor 2 family protein [Candidatus Binataceae bacterium]|nr:nuclear transport factor 2 family protein [Candidatus Binataceae bacterium]
MSVESNKELVTKTWEAFVNGDIKGAFANMSDEISWLIPGNLPNLSGMKKGKNGILDFARNAAKIFPNGLKSEVRRVYGDGDTVIIEMTNRGKLANNRDYENEYCFVFEIEAGKIRRVREYVDTQKVKDLTA